MFYIRFKKKYLLKKLANRSFLLISSFLVSDVSESLISPNQMSDVSKSLRSLTKNERMSESLIFGQKTSYSLGNQMSEFPALRVGNNYTDTMSA